MTACHIEDLDTMAALGRALAGIWLPPRVVGLDGPLGTGKTTLVRSVLAGLGHDGPVPSPSYTLIETYPLERMTVHHLDLYRLGDPEELEFLGVRDLATADALWLVEWPECGGDRLAPLDERLVLEHWGVGRRISGLPASIRVGSKV